jgi:hypothetical protein
MACDARRENDTSPATGGDLAKIGADEGIPHLSAPLIEKYVADLKHLGLLAIQL